MVWGWIAGIVTAIIILLLLPVQVKIVYRRLEGKEKLAVTLRLAGDWGSWEMTMPPLREWWPETAYPENKTNLPAAGAEAGVKRRRSATPKKWSRLARFIFTGRPGYWWTRLKSLIAIWQHFFAGVTCQRFHLFLAPGAGDPAAAALLYGVTWAGLARIYRNVRKYFRPGFKMPPWQVVPHFASPEWQADIDCIFTLRLGHIISATMQSLWLLLKIARQDRTPGKIPARPG